MSGWVPWQLASDLLPGIKWEFYRIKCCLKLYLVVILCNFIASIAGMDIQAFRKDSPLLSFIHKFRFIREAEHKYNCSLLISQIPKKKKKETPPQLAEEHTGKGSSAGRTNTAWLCKIFLIWLYSSLSQQFSMHWTHLKVLCCFWDKKQSVNAHCKLAHVAGIHLSVQRA